MATSTAVLVMGMAATFIITLIDPVTSVAIQETKSSENNVQQTDATIHQELDTRQAPTTVVQVGEVLNVYQK